MIRMVIRADDLGMSEAVNYGIEKSVREGLVRSVGLMPNMPAAEHGIQLMKGLDACIGQHTNICLGKPVCRPQEIPSLVNENGMFRSSREYRDAWKEGKDIVSVEDAVKEAEAQYYRFRELTGHDPVYFEAHAICSANLWKALKIVAEKHHLALCHMTPEMKEGTFNGKPIAACTMESMKDDYDPFETLKKAVMNASEEIPNIFVCHPGYLDEYLLNNSSLTYNRVKEVTTLTDKQTREWLDKQNVQLLSYREIL